MENKIKLLLVEDDSMLTYVVKSSLEGLIGGYEVITAVNGQEGLKAYQEYHPDIIISDVDMPVMNGLQMVERGYDVTLIRRSNYVKDDLHEWKGVKLVTSPHTPYLFYRPHSRLG